MIKIKNMAGDRKLKNPVALNIAVGFIKSIKVQPKLIDLSMKNKLIGNL